MVREAKFSCDVRRYEPPRCRDSVLDDDPSAEKARRPAVKRRRKAETSPAAAPAEASTDAPVEAKSATAAPRPATERRHLAGADWLSGYMPRVRAAK